MFVFEKEQLIYNIGGVKIGGGLGETPTVLAGTIFYGGHKIIDDVKQGTFDKAKATELVNKQDEMSAMTGNPALVQIFAETSEAMIRYIDFVTEVTSAPFLIDATDATVRLAGLRHSEEIGLLDQAIYNSINVSATKEEIAQLKEIQHETALVLAFNPKDSTISGRRDVLENGVMEQKKGLLEICKDIGVTKPLLDTAVTAMGAGAGSAAAFTFVSKTVYGYPTGSGVHNAPASWAWLRKYKKINREAFQTADIASNLIVQLMGADFVLYGPIENADRAFPVVAMGDAFTAESAYLEFGIEPGPDPRSRNYCDEAITLQRVLRPKSIGISSLRMGPFYTVASVELGNTTTKAIIVTTNLKTAEIFEIEKEVRMTRDVRPPKEGEEIFGETVFGVPLTKESVSEMISSILTSVLSKSKLDIERDLHFVVRSTGVTAGFASPEEVGSIVKALADGCLQAGVPPRKMTAAISPEQLPPGLRDFTWLKKVYFDGAIASSLPPSNTEIVANEMEGELVTAGLKGAVKGTDIDFRNPVMTLDFGTTLAGRITDRGIPYAKTIGSFAGLAGAIPDAIMRGTGFAQAGTGCVLDVIPAKIIEPVKIDPVDVFGAHDLITVERVPESAKRYGTVPVDPKAAKESGVVLIGVDADLSKLENYGKQFSEGYSIDYMYAVIDGIQTGVVERILKVAESEKLILEDTSLGLTGRAIISGTKPDLIARHLKLSSGELWTDNHQIVFVEDGLAMGAAVAARCMNSMGTTRHPMGGRKGDRCIMADRMKLQSK